MILREQAIAQFAPRVKRNQAGLVIQIAA